MMNFCGARSRSTSDRIERILHTGCSGSTDQIAARIASARVNGSRSVRATTLAKMPETWDLGW
jgi:hypothetical protein